jgi:hypothetical protein
MMSKKLQEAMDHAADLEASYADLRTMQDEMDDMILMDWKDKPKNKKLKFTVSPEARNTYMGALRLLTSTDPIISVPHNNNDAKVHKEADNIEKICKGVIYQSGRINQRPVHYDLMAQMLRYDEYHLAITDTQDLLDNLEGAEVSKAETHRLQKIADSTPYLFQALDVRSGCWERDAFGLTAYSRCTQMTYSSMRNLFGEKNLTESGFPESTLPGQLLYYHDYWDLDVHFSWISGDGVVNGSHYPIVGRKNEGKHNLRYIPIVCQVGEASGNEKELKYRRQPLLYGAWQAELWERLNLEYTVLYTNLFNVSANPTFLHTRTVEDSKIEPDYSIPGGVIHMNPGEMLTPLMKDVFNKDMTQGILVAQQLFSESTLYKQTLGQPLGGNQAFSTVSLLSQSGRLPLTAYQRCGGWGLGSGCEIMFDLMKDKGSNRTVVYLKGRIEINVKDLPEDLVIDVRLDADLPQDQLQSANVAQMLKQQQITDKAWIRENILNIGQSEDMEKRIIEENFVEQMVNESLRNQMRQDITQEVRAELQQELQQKMYQSMQHIQAGASQGQPAQRQQPPSNLQYQNLRMQDDRRQIDNSRNAGMGGLPPSATGLIPAQRPGEKPVPAENYSGEMQEGEQ